MEKGFEYLAKAGDVLNEYFDQQFRLVTYMKQPCVGFLPYIWLEKNSEKLVRLSKVLSLWNCEAKDHLWEIFPSNNTHDLGVYIQPKCPVLKPEDLEKFYLFLIRHLMP